jgi:hypothetical protein
MPPMIVFPRKNITADLKGTPPDFIAACHPSGWIQQNILRSGWYIL